MMETSRSANEPEILPQLQSYESQTACGDSTMVRVEGKLFLISGFDDGVVCLLEMSRLNGESIKRPIVNKKQGESPQPLAD